MPGQAVLLQGKSSISCRYVEGLDRSLSSLLYFARECFNCCFTYTSCQSTCNSPRRLPNPSRRRRPNPRLWRRARPKPSTALAPLGTANQRAEDLLKPTKAGDRSLSGRPREQPPTPPATAPEPQPSLRRTLLVARRPRKIFSSTSHMLSHSWPYVSDNAADSCSYTSSLRLRIAIRLRTYSIAGLSALATNASDHPE
jgi:hypothetical protein